MADTSLDGFELVGESIQEEPKPTKTPHAGAVANEDASAAAPVPMMQQAGGPEASVGAQFVAPVGEQISEDFSEWELLPSYADGSSPDKPINKSPLSDAERLMLAAGNEKGTLNYLKRTYGEAGKDAEGNFIVKQGDLWHRVDPNGLGDRDAWDVTNSVVTAAMPPPLRMLARGITGAKPTNKEELHEVGRDIIDNVFSGVKGGIIGARGGPGSAAVGFGVGLLAPEAEKAISKMIEGNEQQVAIAAGVLGAWPAWEGVKRLIKEKPALKGALTQTLALAGTEFARTSLGRLVGTYEATAEEQLRDIGIESLLNLGGETVALGVKPTYQMLRNSFVNMASKATNRNKSILAKTWAAQTGRPEEAFRAALDDHKAVLPEADNALKKLGPNIDPKEARGILQREQNALLAAVGNESDLAMKRDYNLDKSKIVAAIPDSASFSPKEAIKEVFEYLNTQGLGKVNEKGVFEPLTTKEMARMFSVDGKNVPKMLGGDTQATFNNIISVLNKYSQFESVKGKMGANKILEFRKALGESLRGLETKDMPDTARALLANIKERTFQNLGAQFAPHGVSDIYVRMNNNYAQRKDLVDMILNATDSKDPVKVENVVKRLVSKSGQFTQLKDEVGDIAQITRDGGEKIRKIINKEHAKSFVDFAAPIQGAGGSIGSGVRAGLNLAAMVPVVGRVADMTTNQQSIASQIAFGKAGLDALKSMGPRQIDALLQDDALMAQFFITMMKGQSTEKSEEQRLLQEAGVER